MARPVLRASPALPVLPVLMAVLALVACAPDAGTGSQGGTTPASPSPAEEAEPAESTPSEPSPEPTAESSLEAVVTGPQACGSVVSTIGETLTVEIIAGDLDCVAAEELLDTYYNDPPSIPEGSGAYLTIGEWECNSSSSQEPGRASTCRHPGGGEIVSLPAEGGAPTPAEDGYCEQIDDPTLDQLFGDEPHDEQVCETYIAGENAIDQAD
ncbi:hypothetical protein LQF12_06295 [Ruania suaedae]|uniref:hypothetical protein n=1 Tax=Ruania suaedae TaxID=2897774 RepID=UPI001E53FFE9|nr:hypothetical protein [Ruania suaedae]UFU04189.1 hypothetical protein LQF12_06295 [Ruania suaedae]